MLQGQDFVVLSDDWNGLPTSAIHLFRRLSHPTQENRVFWFNLLTRLPRPSLADARKVFCGLKNWCLPARSSTRQSTRQSARQSCSTGAGVGSSQRTNVGVTVVSPFMVPWFKKPLRRLNQTSFLRTYHKLQQQHQIRDPIVVTTFPCAVDFVREVDSPCKLYYCVDDFTAYPGIDGPAWMDMESELLATTDALAVVSHELARTRQVLGPTLHLPHGVDLEHYRQAVRSPRPIPQLDALPRPIVGFFGLIGEWTDLELIANLAQAFRHVSFVLVGRSERDLTVLQGLRNVHYLGWVPYAELPYYGARFNVGLIPYDVNNARLRTVNPLKLMEYFALGLPVLALDLPELKDVPGPLYLARTHEEFRAGLAAILDESVSGGNGLFGTREEALMVARANTWDERAERLSDFLEGLLTPPARLSPNWEEQPCVPLSI